MIDLRVESNDRLYDEKEGLLLKHWLIYNGDRYLFKANYRYPHFETYSNYGEVFYSRVLKKLGVKCVDAEFAIDTIQNSPTQGVIIKNFLDNEKYMDSMSYKKIFEFYTLSPGNTKNIERYSSVEACLLACKDFAKRFNFKLNAKAMEKDLVKMAICDFFFCQSDRHDNNIEILFTHDGEMEVAPAFDNGLNLGFPYFSQLSEHYAQDKCSDGKEFNGAYTIFTLRNFDVDMFNDSQREAEQLADIAQYLKGHPECVNLVKEISKVDVGAEIDEMESDCGFGIPDSYKIVGQTILNTRMKMLEEQLIKNGDYELLNEIFDSRSQGAEQTIKEDGFYM